jgi:hypothetical protein
MVRVKLVKEKIWSQELQDWKYTEEGVNVGKEFDAFKTKRMVDDKEVIEYHLDWGDGIYWADAVQVEELDASLDYSNEEGVLKSIREKVEMQSPQFTRVSTQPKKILLIEDGSVNADYVDSLDIPCIYYRQGSPKPEIIEI